MLGAASSRRHALEILRRVDADGIVRGLDGLDPDAVLERPQLFERFGLFERRLLERRQHQQYAPAIRVEADMFVKRRPAAARGSRECGMGAREK